MKQVTIKQIAEALGRDRSVIAKRAKKEGWPSIDGGGKRRLYDADTLPSDVQAALLLKSARTQAPNAAESEGASRSKFSYDSDELWKQAAGVSEDLRGVGLARAQACQAFVDLWDGGLTATQALKTVAEQTGTSWRTIQGWYYGTNGSKGARWYDKADWSVALIPNYKGKQAHAAFSSEAVDWICKAYLKRSKPTFNDCYRRLLEVAAANDWDVPSKKTVKRRINKIPPAQRKYLREGPEALRDTFPPLRRDTSVFGPGEAVSGDGLKVSRYVDWGDEIITTSTVWCWKDIRTGRMLAYYLGKTENTDVFRLSVYKLTGICRPTYVQIDNTTAAANKAMTAGQAGRHRFKDRPEDPPGVLKQMGMEVHWSDPNHDFTTPGSKPIERSFRELHDMIVEHPNISDRGYSKVTAITVAELSAALDAEIKRFNAQRGRRTQACGGIKSFDDAWHELVDGKALPVASEEQREMCLLLPEVVTANRRDARVELSAGRTDLGKPRYWVEALAPYAGQKVVAYYDPDDLTRDIRIHDHEGNYICHAERQADTAFNDVASAREYRKNKGRWMKSQKEQASAVTRMSDMEFKHRYPTPEAPEEAEPRVHHVQFGKTHIKDADGNTVDPDTGEILQPAVLARAVGDDMEAAFERQVGRMHDQFLANHPFNFMNSSENDD